jgi:AraC-like DNA-binding protein
MNNTDAQMKKGEYRYFYRTEMRPLASLSLYEVGCFRVRCGNTINLEKSNSYGLYFVADGKGVYTRDGEKYPLEAGSCFAIYPDGAGSYSADKDNELHLCWVRFNGADARLLINASGFTHKEPVRSSPNIDKAVEVVTGIFAYRGYEIYQLAQSTALLYALMTFLIKETSWDPEYIPEGWTGVVHVQKSLDFIAENFSRSITVDDIAGAVALSRSQLYRLFTAQVGMSPQQYLTEFRVREACTLLQKRECSIKEVSHAVGIEEAYFSSVFKKITGKTPTDYVKNFGKDLDNVIT